MIEPDVILLSAVRRRRVVFALSRRRCGVQIKILIDAGWEVAGFEVRPDEIGKKIDHEGHGGTEKCKSK